MGFLVLEPFNQHPGQQVTQLRRRFFLVFAGLGRARHQAQRERLEGLAGEFFAQGAPSQRPVVMQLTLEPNKKEPVGRGEFAQHAVVFA